MIQKSLQKKHRKLFSLKKRNFQKHFVKLSIADEIVNFKIEISKIVSNFDVVEKTTIENFDRDVFESIVAFIKFVDV